MITWSKLKSGDWGLRSTSQLQMGTSVNVSKKDGTIKAAIVGQEVWNGNGVWIYAVGAAYAAASRAPKFTGRASRGFARCEGWGADNPHPPREGHCPYCDGR